MSTEPKPGFARVAAASTSRAPTRSRRLCAPVSGRRPDRWHRGPWVLPRRCSPACRPARSARHRRPSFGHTVPPPANLCRTRHEMGGLAQRIGALTPMLDSRTPAHPRPAVSQRARHRTAAAANNPVSHAGGAAGTMADGCGRIGGARAPVASLSRVPGRAIVGKAGNGQPLVDVANPKARGIAREICRLPLC